MKSTTRINSLRAAALTMLSVLVVTGALAAPEAEIKIQSDATETMDSAIENREDIRWVPGEVIVKFKEGAEPDGDPQMNAMGVGGAGTRRTSGGEMIYTLGGDFGTAAAAERGSQSAIDVVKTLSARPDVEYAQVNYYVDFAAVPVDPGFQQQWHYFNNGNGPGESRGGINLPQAWDITTGDPGVVVAVIDTGILPGHADITGSANQLGGFDMISNTFTSNDGDGRDPDPTDAGDAIAAGVCPPFFSNPPRGDSWHGTHVAGTIGVGNSNNNTGIAGVSWQSGVLAVRVLGRCGGNVGDINDAIRWAAGMPVPGVPANANPAQIINMSLGADIPCTQSPSTQAAINDVVAMGVTVVVAAGNEAQDAANAMPASCNGVIAVAAADENGDLVTRYSNFGNDVDILAPGGDTQGGSGNAGGVLSTVQGGYAFYNGTSMASPHVAGVVALMLSVSPGMTPQDVENRLAATASARTNLQCPQPCGAGLLDAFAAVDNLVPGPVPVPTPPSPVLDVSTQSISFNFVGRTKVLVARVTAGGVPVAGKNVTFVSSDAAIATVTPGAAVTDASGNAQSTVEAVQKGSTNITVATVGGTATVPVIVTVDVPVFGWLMAALLLMALIGLRWHRARQL